MTSRRSSRKRKSEAPRVEFPLAESSGFLVRDANRAFQRLLEKRIAPYGVARGQWYFLRVLWNEDGLSQRELSARVGTMTVEITVRVTAVDGRKVFFETSVKDELDQVGAGTHTRFVVDKAKTFERLKAKAARFAALSG